MGNGRPFFLLKEKKGPESILSVTAALDPSLMFYIINQNL